MISARSINIGNSRVDVINKYKLDKRTVKNYTIDNKEISI